MIKRLPHFVVVFSVPLLLTGCIDDNYDLDNVDTTTRINVNDLTIPVNIDPVTLGDVIDIESGSTIKTVNLDGKDFYALVQHGEFKSEPVDIDGVSAAAEEISPSHETLDRLIAAESSRRKAPLGEFIFPLKEMGNDFSYKSVDVDEAIVSLSYIKVEPFNFTLTLDIEDHDSNIGSLSFTDVVISAPKGLDAIPNKGSYDKQSGIWIVPRVDVVGSRAQISLTATGIDTNLAGLKIDDSRTLTFTSGFHIKSGYVDVIPTGLNFRDQVDITVYYDLDRFTLKSFDGEVRYNLAGIGIDPVSLRDIPDFLNGTSSLDLVNPQIYLQINNPVGNIPLECRTGLELTARRKNLPNLTYDINSPMTIGYAKGVTGPYNFVISPSDKGLSIPDGYSKDLKWCEFSTLGQILTTPTDWNNKSMPDYIDITLVDPCIPTQLVNDFALPCSFPAAKGRYDVMVPLALNEGSYICYTETRDGWNDEDVDAITVTQLSLTAHAVNACPADIELKVYPIDTDGHEMDAEVTSNIIKGNTEDDLVITLTGEIKHLDGVRLVALLKADDSKEALSPSQTLSLTDIKARITGWYEKKF